METQENQQKLHTISQQDYAFSLIPLNSQTLKFEANFSPLKCKNSCKYIKAIPTYNKQSQISFCTQLDRLTLKKTMSLQHLSSKENLASDHIYVPKPSHNYCQVCKQRFEDYLQHIAHPIHKRKTRETSSQYSVESLKDMLNTPRKLKRKGTWAPPSQSNQLSDYSLENYSVSSKDSHQFNVKMEQADKVSIASSTNNKQMEDDVYQEPSVIVRRRQQRKYSNFRTVRNQQSKMDVQQ